MKRNHGYKIKEKDKQLLKSEKREKQEQYPAVCTVSTVRTGSELKIPTKAELKAKDPFDSILMGSLPTSSIRAPDPPSEEGKLSKIMLQVSVKLCF